MKPTFTHNDCVTYIDQHFKLVAVKTDEVLVEEQGNLWDFFLMYHGCGQCEWLMASPFVDEPDESFMRFIVSDYGYDLIKRIYKEREDELDSLED